MKKRMILMLLVVVFLGAIGRSRSGRYVRRAKAFQPPPEAVTTILAREDAWRRRSTPSGR